MDRNVKFIVTKRWGTVELRRDPADGFWRDASGTIYAFAEAASMTDPISRCGVGFFSLSPSNPLTRDCAPHDFMYSSPVWQAFHTRSESDAYLENLIANDHEAGAWSLLSTPFEEAARAFGGPVWENPLTND